MYSKNGIPWVRPPTHDGQHRENNIGRTEQWSTVSVDLITAIADACKRSEQKNPDMSEEQKETLLGKVADKVMSNYTMQ